MTKDSILIQRHYGGNMCMPTCPQLEQRMYCFWCHFTRAALNTDQNDVPKRSPACFAATGTMQHD